MQKSVYLVTGENLPTKLAVVAHGLAHHIILGIENRFQHGARYSTLTPVLGGVVSLAAPMFGPNDQAYFPGHDVASLTTDGGTDSVPSDSLPGNVVLAPAEPDHSRRAYLVTRTGEKVVEMIVVVDDEGLEQAEQLANAFAELPGAAVLEVQDIGVGTFNVAPKVAETGFTVRVAPAKAY